MLISHISAQDGECCWDEKGNLPLLSCVPPVLLLSLGSAPYSAAKLSRRLSRLPRSLHRNHTGRGVWDVAVTQCVHQCLLTFIFICHDPIQSQNYGLWIFALVLGEEIDSASSGSCMLRLYYHTRHFYHNRRSPFTFHTR